MDVDYTAALVTPDGGSPMHCSPERSQPQAYVSLHQWHQQPCDATYDSLFRLTQPTAQWPGADAFGPSLALETHYARTQITPLMHKATFSLPRCRLKLCDATRCEVRVSGGQRWWALVADCEIAITENAPLHDIELWAPGCEPMRLDTDALFGGGRRLDTRQLAGPGRWCLLSAQDTLHMRLDGPASALALSTETQCDVQLMQAQLEYWTHVDSDDWRLYRPVRFTVPNAAWLMHIYAGLWKLPYSDDSGGAMRPSVRYCSAEAGYSQDMYRLNALLTLRVYFLSHDPVPRFYQGQTLLSVTVNSPQHLTLYSQGDVALADVYVDRHTDVVLRFTLLYDEENRVGDRALYHVYL